MLWHRMLGSKTQYAIRKLERRVKTVISGTLICLRRPLSHRKQPTAEVWQKIRLTSGDA